MAYFRHLAKMHPYTMEKSLHDGVQYRFMGCNISVAVPSSRRFRVALGIVMLSLHCRSRLITM